MLLSFSVPSMLPMVRAGIAQRMGDEIGSEWVKRQTIRRRGKRAEQLLARAKDASWTIPYDLHLWWKSRTPAREFLGKVSYDTSRDPIRVYPIEILHSFVEPTHGPNYQCLRITGPRGWRSGDATIFWSPGDPPGSSFEREALADGFESVEAFRDYFVPNLRDRFEAILFKW
jgi:hypothetical protein